MLLCVHGLTRNGCDFDTIAEALSAHYRVVCPDMPGTRAQRLSRGAGGLRRLGCISRTVAALDRAARCGRRSIGSTPRWAAFSAC